MVRNALSVQLVRGWSLRNVRIYLFAVGCFFFFSRFALLNLNKAEFTDGYLILQWSFADPNRWHPLYPLLTKAFALFTENILAGRLVSILAGLLTILPISQIAGRLYGNRTALIACLLFAVSPLHLWVESHVLTESLFVLMSLLAVQFYLADQQKTTSVNSDFLLFTLFAVLSYLTRPEGYIFLPIWIYAAWVHIRKKQNAKIVLKAIPLIAPAVVYLLWMHSRAPREMYESGMSSSLHSLFLPDVVQRLIGYVEIYPYVVVYPVFVLGALHFLSSARPAGRWPRLVVYIHIIFFFTLGIHPAWSSRFLILPATLILIESAAMLDLLRQRWSESNWRFLVASVLVACLLFSAFSLWGQRNTFADFKTAGIQIAYDRQATQVYSDEITKTAFYAERLVLPYSRAQVFHPGALIVLHSFHTDLAAEWNFLRTRYEIEAMSASRSEILPLLASLPLEKDYLTNNPVASFERFQPQRFQTVILRVQKSRMIQR